MPLRFLVTWQQMIEDPRHNAPTPIEELPNPLIKMAHVAPVTIQNSSARALALPCYQ